MHIMTLILNDITRRFVVSFYVLDDTISIFEPKVPNAGIRGGTYLERTKVWKGGRAVILCVCQGLV